MTPKNSISRLIIAALCFCTASLYAQDASQAVFNSAVDQINCETIRFIHREAGRAEIANNMQCTSYESIAKTVPEDEAKTTGQVARDIEAFKTKFKADKPLDAQLDQVIAFADKKITAKKRKGNVEDFKTRLEQYKADALANAGGNAPASSSSASTQTEKTEKSTAGDTGKAIMEPVSTSGSGTKKKDWLGVIGVLLGLVSLAFAIPAFMASRRLKTGIVNGGGADEGMNVSRPIDEESYRRLEARMQQEISSLRRSFEEQIGTITASTGYTEPESKAVKEEKKPEPEIKAAASFESYKPAATASLEQVHKTETKEPEFHTNTASHTEAPAETETKEPEPITPNTSFATPEPTPAAPVEDTPAVQHDAPKFESEDENLVLQPEDPTISNSFREAYTASPQAQMPDESGSKLEEAEAMPIYRYVGLPSADGTFAEQAFTDNPKKDSVFEIEMYEDVPNKAFFSLLPYPEIVKSALQNPKEYLDTCCLYTDDPSGKNTIILLEEGMLRKQEGKWQVYEKARVRFE